jgi:hypothetical protein
MSGIFITENEKKKNNFLEFFLNIFIIFSRRQPILFWLAL